MEELRKFHSSAFDTIVRRKFIEDQNTILVLSGRVQELQNEVNCMNDSMDFQNAESVRSGNSHVTSRPVSFPPHPIPEGMLRHSFVSPFRREGPPSIWDTHGISGNVSHRVALDWLFDRINLDPKIQIKYIDTKNQLADILTKGNFTRDEWNHLLTLCNISHFSSTACIAAMAKRAQQESGEGRVTAKSRPMMNLTARTPSFVSSSASLTRGGPRMDIKILKDLFLTIERGNPLKRQDQTIHKRIMVYRGLLKSGKVEMESTIDQGNLIKILGIHWEKLTLIVENIFSAGRRIPQGTKRLFTIERGNLCQRIFKERLILKISLWEVR